MNKGASNITVPDVYLGIIPKEAFAESSKLIANLESISEINKKSFKDKKRSFPTFLMWWFCR